MHSLVLASLAVLALGCARPSLRDELASAECSSFPYLDAGTYVPVLPPASADAGVEAYLASLESASCRGGDYTGRFSCGPGASSLNGTVSLTLSASGSATTLHATAPSLLAGLPQTVSERFAAAVAGTVRCDTEQVELSMRGTYAVPCLTIAVQGDLDGQYDAQRNTLRGRMTVMQDVEDDLYGVALQCKWCASLESSGAPCLP